MTTQRRLICVCQISEGSSCECSAVGGSAQWWQHAGDVTLKLSQHWDYTDATYENTVTQTLYDIIRPNTTTENSMDSGTKLNSIVQLNTSLTQSVTKIAHDNFHKGCIYSSTVLLFSLLLYSCFWFWVDSLWRRLYLLVASVITDIKQGTE